MMKWVFGICLLGWSQLSSATETLLRVDALLQRASEALQEKDYRGRFTYEFGDILETLEVVHAVRDGKEYERIRHLSGTEREFVRSGRPNSCVTVGHFLLRGGLSSVDGHPVSLAQNYHFFVRGGERIADRRTQIVQAVPKDEYRFGMTIAFDENSGIPLMSLVTSGANRALERFQFVSIDVGADISEQDLKPQMPAPASQTLDGSSVQCIEEKPHYKSAWQPGWLPPGFLLTQSSFSDQDGDVLTFTDGIASFSVFIRPAIAGDSSPQGMARRGATLALLSTLQVQKQPYNVVLVGEVPTNTAQKVVSSLKLSRQP